MRKRKRMYKKVACLLTAALLVSGVNIYNSSATVEAKTSDNAIQAFKNPGKDEKPMARMWFPDAYAGIDDDDTIEKQIQELADAGFGGVEVTMLADGTSFDNEDAATIGWGTDAWRELLKKVLTTANSIEGGFTVDITLTAHWPLTINNIDPNDDAASQELVSTYQKVTADDIQNKYIDIELPDTKFFDQLDAPFIFTDTLVSTSLLQVTSVEDDGSIILDYDSAQDITNDVKTTGITTAAGIPDETALNNYTEYAEITDDDVISYFGEAADSSSKTKIDTDGNRKRMADTQQNYQVDFGKKLTLDSSSLNSDETIAAGDYILVNTFRRGTGEVFSDGGFGGYSISMHNRCYTPDYFSSSGVEAVTNYWKENFLTDKTLVKLLKENQGSIFEDSIELSTGSNGSFWTTDMLSDVKDIEGQNYQYTSDIPLVIGITDNSSLSFSDTSETALIAEDYNSILGDLYESEHTQPIKEFAESFDYSFRAQTYTLTGLDVAGAATTVDIPEGDNASKGDGIRTLAASASLADKDLLSMEAVTGMGNNCLNWEDILTEVSQNYSDGVNHVILHGTPYSKTYNGYNSGWPGWMAFGNCFSDSYSYRQTYWEDSEGLTTFMAKTQAILQNTDSQIDIAVLNDESTAFELTSGNAFQELLDHGYSYNILTESLLDQKSATVKDTVLDADGAGYKALVLNEVSTISQQAMEKICNYANAGLPIILYNCDISSIYGTDSSKNSVDGMEKAYRELLSKDNVYVVSDEEGVLTDLQTENITPDASYDQSEIETTHYLDSKDGTDYYYMFYNTMPDNTGMVNPGNGSSYKTDEAITTEVTVTGNGVPYLLDATTGTITPVAAYTQNSDGTITTNISLSGGESTILAITTNTEDFPASYDKHVESTSTGNITYDEEGNLIFSSDVSGNYTVQMSDGTERNIEINNTLENDVLSTSGWNMEFTSFGPDQSESNLDTAEFDISSQTYTLYKDPSATEKVTEEFTNITLGDIGDITATQEQLDEMGVSSMQDVSGIAVYSKEITLPDDWDKTTGAVLKLDYNRDEITGVEVNGNAIDIVSNITDSVDISQYLLVGETNTITVKLATNLLNRTLVENDWAGDNVSYTNLGSADTTGAKQVQLGQTSRNVNGLNTVTLIPYTSVNISEITDSVSGNDPTQQISGNDPAQQISGNDPEHQTQNNENDKYYFNDPVDFSASSNVDFEPSSVDEDRLDIMSELSQKMDMKIVKTYEIYPSETDNVTQTDNTIHITFDLPDECIGKDCKMICVLENGESYVYDNLSTDTSKFSFDTNEFSSFCLTMEN